MVESWSERKKRPSPGMSMSSGTPRSTSRRSLCIRPPSTQVWRSATRKRVTNLRMSTIGISRKDPTTSDSSWSMSICRMPMS